MAKSIDSAAFWTKAARKYAASPIRDMDGYLTTLERTKYYLNPTETVLEMGCGTGSTALLLAPYVNQITATDISPGMIEIAKEKQHQELVENIDFEVSDVVGHSLETGPYDVVLAHNLLHLLPDLDAALAHICKLTKPGGLFISKTVCAPERSGLKFALLNRLAIPLMQAFGKAPHVEFTTANDLERKISAVGFTVVETVRQSGFLHSHYIVARKK